MSAQVVFSRAVSGIFRAVLSPDVMKTVSGKSEAAKDLNGKLRFLQKELQAIVDGKVSNCSYASSTWDISQVYSSKKCLVNINILKVCRYSPRDDSNNQ